jgi:hypothetical protein
MKSLFTLVGAIASSGLVACGPVEVVGVEHAPAETAGSDVFVPAAHPYGASLADWAARFWK